MSKFCYKNISVHIFVKIFLTLNKSDKHDDLMDKFRKFFVYDDSNIIYQVKIKIKYNNIKIKYNNIKIKKIKNKMLTIFFLKLHPSALFFTLFFYFLPSFVDFFKMNGFLQYTRYTPLPFFCIFF